MSHENKGSMTTSIVVAQDGTGNFDCTGVNDQVEIALAITRAVNTGVERIKFKPGTYDINNLTITQPIEIVGEEGVIWDFPATPSLTIQATTIFEDMEFYTNLDDLGQVVIENGDVTFKDIYFNFPVDTGEETNISVMANNPGTPNRIELRNCRLLGGKADADHFGFLRFVADTDALIVRHFVVENIIADLSTTGIGQIFKVNANATLALADFKDIDIITLDIADYVSFIHVIYDGMIDACIIDGFYSPTATYGDATSIFNPIVAFETFGSLTVSNMELHGQFHPVCRAFSFEMDNVKLYGNGNVGSWDCGTTDTEGGIGQINNLYVESVSLTMNRGWRNFLVSNSMFVDSRLNLIDEDTPDRVERLIKIVNNDWIITGTGKYSSCICITYGATGVNISNLQVCNTCFDQYTDANMVVFDITNAPDDPTRIICEDIVVKGDPAFSWPRFIDGTARDNDNQMMWIFDSEILTYEPPLADWNNIRTNDRFDNVRWIDSGDASVTYSERHGIASITGAVNVVDVNHELVDGTVTRYTLQIEALGNAMGAYYVSSKDQAGTLTDFRITFANQPAAGTWYFDWNAWMMR